MENPLEVQRSLYGEDGPPMIFLPEASALHLEMRAPPSKRACAPTESTISTTTEKPKKRALSAREVFAMAMERRQSYSSHHTSTPGASNNIQKQPSPCQLPGYFPEELSFRSLAAYSLLRTLSIQLRLSPFTPNAFLRALVLPAPNRLLGDVHVALLRILFVQKLKNMGYSYKASGGGVGVSKKRQVDGIRWPLLAGDNLTHLDGHSWPLFYDDYCHLTADRLWESYHGPLDADGDGGQTQQNFIDFRNIGVFVPPRGGEYKTKMQADDVQITTIKGDEYRGTKTKTFDKVKIETTVDAKPQRQLPLHIPSSSIPDTNIGVKDDITMLDSDKSESEEEYQAGDDDDDDDEAWEKPKRKKRRKTPKKNTTPTPTPGAATPQASTNEQKNISSAPTSCPRINSLEPSVFTPAAMPTQSKGPNVSSDPNWSRNVSSVNQSQQSIPTTVLPASTQIASSNADKSLQEVALSKSIEPKPEINVSEQQPQQEQVAKAESEAPKTDDSISRIDPSRIRGGGILDGSSGRPSMGRPRGARRALPMRSNSSIPPNLPAHVQQSIHQQQQFMLYQSQQIIAQKYQLQYPSAPAVVTSEKLKLQRTSFETVEEPDAPFRVSDSVATAVNAVVRGTSAQEIEVGDILGAADVDKDESDSESVIEDPAFEEKLEAERWKHFQPLKAMRTGLPYHRLPIEDKICVLEFLLDELLTVDAIAAEFTKREINGMHNTSPYGRLPKEGEYSNMENRDECAVCGQEGDLMCCDGCSSSYHAYCLGMKVGEELPDGKWLCPECSLVDPSNYGSLHGGQKGSLDWFSLDEITNPSIVEQQYNPFGSMVNPQHPVSFPGLISNVQTVNAMQNLTAGLGITAAGHIQTTANPQSQNTQISKKWKDKQFIVVHGFVFYRDSNEGKATFDGLKPAKPYISLTKTELEAFTSETEDALVEAWPLVQIPIATRPAGSWKFPSLRDYFARNESIDPFRYNNKYYGAPMSIITKVGAANNMVKLMYLTYETECEKVNTSTISEVLTQDFSLDEDISTCLKTQTGLFDPFQPLKGYMLKLEHTLRRSCMLTEFWESGQFKSRGDAWVSRIQEAQSIRALCRLLLKLVNAMHARAFAASWFQSPVSKSSDTETSSERNYKALPLDWTEEKEKLKRKWEMTPSKMVLSLCSDNELKGFASKIRTDIFIPKIIHKRKGKRKLKKAASLLNMKKLKQTDENAEPEKQFDHANREQVKGEQKPIANVSEDGNDHDMDELPQEALRNPEVVKPLKVNEIGKKEELVPNSDQLQPEANNVPLHTENALTQVPLISCEGKGDHDTQAQENHLKQYEQSQISQLRTENKLESEMVLERPSSCGTAETTKKNELEKNAATQADMEIHSKTLGGTSDVKQVTSNFMASGDASVVNTVEKVESENVAKSLEIPEGEKATSNTATAISPSEETSTAKVEAVGVSKAPEGEEGRIENIAASENVDGNTTSKSGKKKRKKRSPKSKPREPSSRRRTRHSDRLSSEHLVGNAKVSNTSEGKESNKFEALEGMALQIENVKKQKIPGIEKLLKGQYAIEGIWPIAGRRVFPTVGNIPPKEMKSIARNAGSTIAANLSYHTNHEVAQVSYGHIWRKRVHLCNRFEELLYLLRTLESYLDRTMIHQCENQTRRGKSSLQKVIRCTARNPSSGLLDHFLMNKKSLKGCWVPGEQLDLSSLILDLFCRRQRQKEQRMERVRAKERIEKQIMERERQIRIAEATRQAQEEKIRKEEARIAAKMRKQEDAAKTKLEQEARRRARILSTQQAQQNKMNNTSLSSEVASLHQKLLMVFASHEMEVLKILQFYGGLNIANVPEKEIIKIRKKTVGKIEIINDRLQRCNEPVMDNEQLFSRLFRHEKNAATKMRTPNDSVGTMAGNSQNINVNAFSQAGNGGFQSSSSNMFSQPNKSPNVPPSFGNEQKRPQQLFSNFGSGILSPEPIKNQMESSHNSNHKYLSGGIGYFDASNKNTGLQSSSSRGGIMNQSLGHHPQKIAGNLQNQPQVQNSGSQYYTTPNSKKNPFLGPSPGGKNMFSNPQQSSLPNHQVNATSPNAFSNSISPIKLAELQRPRQRQHQQPHLNSGSLTPMQAAHQQHQPSRMDFSKQVPTQNRQVSQPGYPNAQSNVHPPMPNTQQQYSNRSFNQKDSAMDYRRQQTGMNQQEFRSSATAPVGHLNASNGNHQAANFSNAWNQPTSMANSHNNSSHQNQPLFPGIQQQQRRQQSNQLQRQQQLQTRNYASTGMNPSLSVNSFQGGSSMPGQYGNSNQNQMNPGSQPHNDSRQAFNVGYGQPNNTMNQNSANTFPGQQQQQSNFARNINFPYNANGANQIAGGQNRLQSSRTPSMQHQDFRGQQKYSQSQQNQQQQQPQNQLASIQRQIYMLQQQQKQQQQKQQQYRMPNGQFNPGQNGNNFYS